MRFKISYYLHDTTYNNIHTTKIRGKYYLGRADLPKLIHRTALESTNMSFQEQVGISRGSGPILWRINKYAHILHTTIKMQVLFVIEYFAQFTLNHQSDDRP